MKYQRRYQSAAATANYSWSHFIAITQFLQRQEENQSAGIAKRDAIYSIYVDHPAMRIISNFSSIRQSITSKDQLVHALISKQMKQ